MNKMLTFPVIVLTNPKHHWLLGGFAYQFNRYFHDQNPVTVVTSGRRGDELEKELPPNFNVMTQYREALPAGRWSNGLLELLSSPGFPDPFILMLEDYWLYKPIDCEGLGTAWDWFGEHDNRALRLDLSLDRASLARKEPVSSLHGYHFFESLRGSNYQLSFQAAIWRKEALAQCLIPDENPWEAEVLGTARLNRLKNGFKVYGTEEGILFYQPVWRSKRRAFQLTQFSVNDIAALNGAGFLTPK